MPLAVVAVPCSQTRFRLQSTEQEARTAVAALKAKLVHAEQAAAKQAQSLAAVKGLHAASDQARRASLSSLQHTPTRVFSLARLSDGVECVAVQRVDELVAVVEELREQLQQKDAAGVLASRELEAEKSTAHGLRRSLQERNEEVCLPLFALSCMCRRACGVVGCGRV